MTYNVSSGTLSLYTTTWSKSDSQLFKYCVVCEISWCKWCNNSQRF